MSASAPPAQVPAVASVTGEPGRTSTTSASVRSTPCTSSRATPTVARCSRPPRRSSRQFPEFDQNRGIRRAIPLDFDGHPTDLVVESVTDATGAPRAFETESDEAGEFLLVTVRADDFVHGEQTYVITLPPAQRDVRARRRGDRRVLLGRERHRLAAAVRVGARRAAREPPTSSARSPATRRATAARADRRQPCDSLVVEPTGGRRRGRRARAVREPLVRGRLPADGTFEPRDESFGASPAAITGAVGAAFRGARDARGDRAARHALARPPGSRHDHRAVRTAGRAQRDGVRRSCRASRQGRHGDDPRTGRRRRAPRRRDRAQAVRGRLRRRRARRSRCAGRRARALQRQPAPGRATRAEDRHDTTLGRKLLALRQKVRKRVVQSGLRRQSRPRRPGAARARWRSAARCSAWSSASSRSTISVAAPGRSSYSSSAIIAALVTTITVADVRPLTESGRARRATTSRGCASTSASPRPTGCGCCRARAGRCGSARPAACGAADRRGRRGRRAAAAAGTVPDPATVLKLNERLLPYAVLFGLEREWSDELAALYAREGGSPNWYSGSSGFNAAAFAAGVSSFSSVSSASWSGSSSSSSSSGSGGGGSSGGGGGGGGGGGV